MGESLTVTTKIARKAMGSRALSTFLFCALLTNFAHAGEMPSVYGFSLGVQASVPSCDDESVRDSSKLPFIDYTEACSETLSFTVPNQLWVRFPSAEAPKLARGGRIVLHLHDNEIEGISWGTQGVYDAASIVDALTAKFGKPTSLKKEQVHKMSGQTFAAWNVVWKRRGYVVKYDTIGPLQHIDVGSVEIYTDTGMSRKERSDKERTSGQRYSF